MEKPNEDTKRFLDYRIQSIEVGLRALEYTMLWDDPVRPMKIYFDDKLTIEGNSLAFTNPAIEAAMVHCRALLEFLGLRALSENKIGIRKSARDDDVVIEHFSNEHGPLLKISIAEAVSTYKGKPEEAENALAYVIHTVNKGLAHTTSNFSKHDRASILLEIAFSGAKALMINRFYNPLALERPKSIVETRRRDPTTGM